MFSRDGSRNDLASSEGEFAKKMERSKIRHRQNMVRNDKEERENRFLSRYSFLSGNFGLKFVKV